MNVSKMIAPHIKGVAPSGIRKYFDLINEIFSGKRFYALFYQCGIY